MSRGHALMGSRGDAEGEGRSLPDRSALADTQEHVGDRIHGGWSSTGKPGTRERGYLTQAEGLKRRTEDRLGQA